SAASPFRTRSVIPPMAPSKSKLTLCPADCSNFGMSSVIAGSMAEPDRILISAAAAGLVAARAKEARRVSARHVRSMNSSSSLRELAQRKSRHVAQQCDEAVGLMLGGQTAFFCGGG